MMNATEAFALLRLTPNASPEDIHRRFRQLSKIAHPDGGGTVYAYDQLVQARLAATRYALDDMCPNCAGVGRVLLSRGWQSVMMPCELCGETGKRHPAKTVLYIPPDVG
jgi:DnaJ-class molecular chaperone